MNNKICAGEVNIDIINKLQGDRVSAFPRSIHSGTRDDIFRGDRGLNS